MCTLDEGHNTLACHSVVLKISPGGKNKKKHPSMLYEHRIYIDGAYSWSKTDRMPAFIGFTRLSITPSAHINVKTTWSWLTSQVAKPQ